MTQTMILLLMDWISRQSLWPTRLFFNCIIKFCLHILFIMALASLFLRPKEAFPTVYAVRQSTLRLSDKYRCQPKAELLKFSFCSSEFISSQVCKRHHQISSESCVSSISKLYLSRWLYQIYHGGLQRWHTITAAVLNKYITQRSNTHN